MTSYWQSILWPNPPAHSLSSTHHAEWHAIHATPLCTTAKKNKTITKYELLLDTRLLHGENPHQHGVFQPGTWICTLGNQIKHMGVSMAGINGLNAPASLLGMGRDYNFKLNKITSYSTFPNQPITLDPTQKLLTDQYIFDSGTTDAFYQPSTMLACTLPGKHPKIHAIQPNGSSVASTTKNRNPLNNTNVAIKGAAGDIYCQPSEITPSSLWGAFAMYGAPLGSRKMMH